ncbi:hypothetical protein BO82DRAFT_22374 [Aspergillus uvarum CBS 121591]|uniref:Uncharacterized protein n=1 Tax=Aspergillus uvarum CBS 121591 TaxID=1448315 RepID=A0A319CI28_9EURO|nr:hypothetical protein BO82DRAFT_22374 [Aspergillus uvarum CBS 121591]PYH84120.1 hypothetical protein BO82DRAFT_22374 [Aspergillus uvarum CBS 121591]
MDNPVLGNHLPGAQGLLSIYVCMMCLVLELFFFWFSFFLLVLSPILPSNFPEISVSSDQNRVAQIALFCRVVLDYSYQCIILHSIFTDLAPGGGGYWLCSRQAIRKRGSSRITRVQRCLHHPKIFIMFKIYHESDERLQSSTAVSLHQGMPVLHISHVRIHRLRSTPNQI